MMVSAGRRVRGRLAARGAWGLAVVLGLNACAGSDVRRIPRQSQLPPLLVHAPAPSGPRYDRETQMNAQWQNRPVSDLLGAFGHPRMVLNIPGGGMPPSYAVIYGQDPDTGCIDAFAVSNSGEPVIRVYHCR
jgi:hypothetical protein